jgi:hypothetical protein
LTSHFQRGQFSALGIIEGMDHDTFVKLAATLHHWHGSASEVAGFIIAPLLLTGGICGIWLTRWIFRGGLSRSRFQVKRQNDIYGL